MLNIIMNNNIESLLEKIMNILRRLAYKHRWIKRLTAKYLPEIDSIYLKSTNQHLFFSAKDLTGPSFHLSFGKEDGFQNYEESDKDFVVDHLIKNPGLFVDVGANIGLFSFYILHKLQNQPIFAFEPEPQAFKCLEFSKTRNNFESFTPFNFAIGEKIEKIHFFLDSKNFGGHHLKRLSKDEKLIEVSVSPLSPFIVDQKISAIKVDVEGAELTVLKSMVGIIESHKPLLVVECINEDLGKKGPLYEMLSDLKGIRCLSLKLNRFVSIDEIAKFALDQYEKKHLHDNYFFMFE